MLLHWGEHTVNANELAYDWEHTAFISEESKQECGDKMAVVLRQQQVELDALKERNLFLEAIYKTIKAQEK